jgi:lactate dehydrogenase-like 2-hydroxyacid dehydrogenase
VRIAILDDYQNVALSMADWAGLKARTTITVFNDHLPDADAVVARLQPFDVVCVMRAIISRLPKLRLIASTATRNASIDLEAAAERGIEVVHTSYSPVVAIAPKNVPERLRPRCAGRGQLTVLSAVLVF